MTSSRRCAGSRAWAAPSASPASTTFSSWRSGSSATTCRYSSPTSPRRRTIRWPARCSRPWTSRCPRTARNSTRCFRPVTCPSSRTSGSTRWNSVRSRPTSPSTRRTRWLTSPSGSGSAMWSSARSISRSARDRIDVTGYTRSFEPAMRLALAEAAAGQETRQAEDVPVGAVILDEAGTVIARARNRREIDRDPTAHAEIVAIRQAAAALGNWRLTGLTLVVTLEPCTMCAGAVTAARLARVVYGAEDPKAGAVGSLWDVLRDTRLNHRPEVIGGILAAECGELLRDFFAARRADAG